MELSGGVRRKDVTCGFKPTVDTWRFRRHIAMARKHKPAHAAAGAESASSSASTFSILLGVALAGAGAWYFGGAFLPDSGTASEGGQSDSSPSSPSSAPEASPAARTAPLSVLGSTAALQHFSASHNASLRWGTYRPGVYFGLRSLTAPTALSAGLMWASEGAGALRHQCEQDGLERYGFMAHDGRGYGSQPIVDEANGVALQTSFVASGDGGWTVRLEAKPTAKRGATAATRPLSLYFYVAVDSEFAPSSAETGRLRGVPRKSFQAADAM